MNRAEFTNAMGECPFIPCQCGGSQRCLDIHADLMRRVQRRVEMELERPEWDGTEGTERRSIDSLIARRRAAELAELENRIETAKAYRGGPELTAHWAPSMTWFDRVEDKASEFVYSDAFLWISGAIILGTFTLWASTWWSL